MVYGGLRVTLQKVTSHEDCVVKTEGVVDIFQAIKSARMQRPGLVSDSVSHNATLSGCYISMWCFSPQAQYAFCHEVVASYVDTFETYANFKEVM